LKDLHKTGLPDPTIVAGAYPIDARLH